MKKLIRHLRLTLMLLFAGGLFQFSFAQTLDWGYSQGSTGIDLAVDVAVDGSGNTVNVGSFNGTIDFDPGTGTSELTSNGLSDIYIQKLNSSGELVWIKQIGGTSTDNVYEVILDGSGNVYVSGDFRSTVDFDPGAGTNSVAGSSTDSDLFLLKLTSSGSFSWVYTPGVGSSSIEQAISVAVDGSGNCYLTGKIFAGIDFDNGAGTTSLGGNGGWDAFLVKLNSSGSFLSGITIGGTGNDIGEVVIIDGNGDILVGGTYSSTVDFDPGVGTAEETSNGSTDAFITKYNSSLTYQSVTVFGGTSAVNLYDLAIDGDGAILSIGNFLGTVDFDPGLGTDEYTATNSDVFVQKLNSSGDFVWTSILNFGGAIEGKSISINNTKAYVGGTNFLYVIDSDGTITYNGFMSGTLLNGLISTGSKIYVAGQIVTGTASADLQPCATGTNPGHAGAGDAIIAKYSIESLADLPTIGATSELICGSGSVTLSISAGSLNSASDWQWYSGSCGGTSLGSGTSIIVSPTATTTYFVRGEGYTCYSNGSCSQITISFSAPPTDMALGNSSIIENSAIGTSIGIFSATDATSGDSHTFSLVSGTGDTGNASFSIDGNQLKSAEILNYETNPSYAIRVQALDQAGCTFQEEFSITVSDVSPEAPSDISLSNASVIENASIGTLVGALTSADDDAGDSHTYTLVSGTGDTDNSSFSISGSELQSAASFDFETKSSYSVRIRSTDASINYFEKSFTISVTDVVETGTDITSFSLSEEISAATSDAVNHTVTINIGFGNSKTSLTPTITVSSGGAISPNTGVAQNFTSPVNYTVTAENGDNQVWVVTVQTLIPEGTYTIGSGGTFSTLLNAFNGLTANGISGNVRLEFLDGHTDSGGTLNGGWAGEDDYTVTITPETDATSVSISSANYTLQPNNWKNVVFDGKNITSITTTATNRYAIFWALNSECYNVAFKNLNIYSGQGTAIVTRGSDNIEFSGNTFEFYTTPPQENISIINALSVTNLKIIGNTVIIDSRYNSPSSSIHVFYSGYEDNLIANNIIYAAPTAAASFWGIQHSGLMYNNTIVVDGPGTIGNIVGIRNNVPSSNSEVFNNVIHISTSHTTATCITTSNASLDMGSNHMYLLDADGVDNIYIQQTNNNYGSDDLVAIELIAPKTTFGEVLFTDKSSEDFTLTGASLSNSNLRGLPIAAVTTDINGDTRSTTAPSKGAFESPNNIATITGFTFTNQAGIAVIDEANFTIDAEITVGQSLTSISPAITLFAGASVTPLSGVAQDFTNDVTYTVTAEASNTQEWVVSIKEQNAAPTDISLSASSINENLSMNTEIGTFSCTDGNSGDSHTYSLVSGTGDTDNANFTISNNKLLSASVFNYESKNSYSIRIETNDGNEGTFAEAFTITINNVSEVPTNINHSSGFSLQFTENNSENAVVTTFSTEDQDAGETYTYTFVTGTGDTDNTAFQISGNELQALISFNYETKSSYSFRVQTNDGNGGTFQKAFTLTILNQYETPTDLALSSAIINENNSVDDVIGDFSTTDQDAGETYLYSLVSGIGDADNGSFTITGNQLLAGESFNYESKASYSIRIQTDDQHSGLLEKEFSITIVDINEAPTNVLLSSTTVTENLEIGTSVGTLTAVDEDESDSHTYTLKVTTPDNAFFTISGDQLLTGAVFDYESKSTYNLEIITDDDNGGTFEQEFAITISDVPASISDITLSESSFDENLAAGSAIGTFDVTGIELTGIYAYTLVAGTGDTQNTSFYLDGNVLKNAGVFNYEAFNSASIRISVSGTGGSFEKAFTITVNNVAEEPTDISLSNTSIQESLSIGTIVGQLSTTDEDQGETYTYTFVSGSGDTDNASFSINGSQLHSAEVFDFETKTSYSVRIQTNDGNGNSFSKSFAITIDDVAPMITDIGLTNDSFDENQAAGLVVGSLSTLGEEVTGTYTYSLVTGAGDTQNASFFIVGNELKTAGAFNFEAFPTSSIRVRTDDGQGASFDKVFTIYVNDVSEAPTNLLLSETSIDENNAANAVIGSFTTTDEDAGETYSYSLVAGSGDTDNDDFQITDDQLQAVNTFNFEEKSSYSIRIQTNDGNGGIFEKDFTLSINDVAEAPTALDLAGLVIDENNSLNDVIGTFQTTDEDAGETYTYTLASGDGDADNASFSIVGDQLLAGESYNYELKSSYSIRVQTDDGNGGTFEEIYSISVNDTNDNPTDISLDNSSIEESNPSGTLIGSFGTIDEDSGQSHTYSLVSGSGDTDNGSFIITGDALMSNQIFDFESQSSYSIRIQTNDGNGGTYQKELTISILDLNAQITSFTLSVQSVDENTSIGTSIGSFATEGEDLSGSYTYSLVSGTGDADNASFSLSGADLLTAEVFDFENSDSYSVRVMTDDGNGNTLEKAFTIQINDVSEAPSDLNLSVLEVAENNALNELIGSFSTIDQDTGETYAYTLVSGDGATDNSSFSIQSDELRASEIFDFETKNSYSIRIETNDGNGGTFQKSLTISVTNENEGISLLNPLEDKSLMQGFGSYEMDLSGVFEDQDGDLLNLSVSSANTSVMTVSNTGSTLSIVEVGIGSSVITVTADDGQGMTLSEEFTVTVSIQLSTEAEILSFSFAEQTGPATLDATLQTISIEVANGTDLTSLIPTISISTGATISPLSGMAIDFSAPVVFTVTAEDGVTTQDWTVTVSEAAEALSSEAEILSFSFAEQTGPATLDATLQTISIEVANGTDLTSLIPNITISTGATVSPLSGVAIDFSAPVVFTVTAEDGNTTQDWTVTVSEAVEALSSEADIQSFSFAQQTGPATLDATLHSINIEVANGTDLTSLIPTITVSTGATISPQSGVAIDFSSPVVFTVTAENGTTTQDWTVTVTEEVQALSSEAEILTFSFSEQTGPATIDATLQTISIEVVNGTDLTSLVPTITVSTGATISPLSGFAIDFSSPVVFTVNAEDGTTTLDWTVTVTEEVLPLSSEAEILSFSFVEQTGVATIDATLQTISIEVAKGTDLTSLVPTITVSTGATISPLSGVAIDFSAPVVFTVTAENGTTTQDWTVTVMEAVLPLSSEAEILSFSFAEQTDPATIDATLQTISIEVVNGTDLTSLIPTITVSTGATISPLSGVAIDFSAPVVFTVTAENGTTTQDWTVTVMEAVLPLSSEAEILSFSFAEQTDPATIDATLQTISIEVANGTDLTSLIPTITVSTGATISPLSGVAIDFSAPVVFTVTAEDGNTTQDWTVTVSEAVEALSSEADIQSFSFVEQTSPATLDASLKTISIEVVNGTDLTSLVPTITVSAGATISPVSGVAIDFSVPVVFTVTAEDGTTAQDWTVTVTEAVEELSSEAEILTFSFEEQTGSATIDTNTNAISVEVANGSDLTSLVPTITVSTGATISPLSGVAMDFSASVLFTVTAEEGLTTQDWTVTVTLEEKVLGIDEELSIEIFPNPVLDFLKIESANSVELVLTDLNGRILNHKSGYDLNVDMRLFPSGVYLLTIKSGDAMVKQKIVKIN